MTAFTHSVPITEDLRPDLLTYQLLDEKCGFSWVPLKMTGNSAGKRPIENDWSRWCEQKKPLSEIKHLWSLGIACGPASSVLVLDLDDVKKFKALGLPTPKTFTVRTGSGGIHYFYKYPTDGKRYGNRSYSNGSGIFDVRGIGGQVVAPGSVHVATGNRYEIIDDSDIADAPEWLLNYSLTGNLDGVKKTSKVVKKTTPIVRGWDNSIDGLPIKQETKDLITGGAVVGQRSEAMMKVINALVWSGLADSEIFEINENYPIGEKYLEKGATREKWLQSQIDKARAFVTDRADYGQADYNPANEASGINKPGVMLPGNRCRIQDAGQQLGVLLAATGEYYERGGAVKLEKNNRGDYTLEPLSFASAASVFEQVAKLLKIREGKKVPGICTKTQAELILLSSGFNNALPKINLLSPCPVLIERNGQLVTICGYDKAAF